VFNILANLSCGILKQVQDDLFFIPILLFSSVSRTASGESG
jgi:hypothetical protein